MTRDPEAVKVVGKILADDWVKLEPLAGEFAH